MANPSIHRIERFNYALTAVLTLIALFTQSQEITAGFAVGAGLTCLNFFVLRKLVVKWTAEAAQGKAGNAQLLMLPKMIGLMGLVAIAILLLPINVIAFAAGYSIFLASIVIEVIYGAVAAAPAESTGEPAAKGNGHG